MKRLKSLAIFPFLLLASLTACSKPAWKSGDKVYYDRIVFDTSDATAKNPHIFLGEKSSVKTVKLGRDEIKFWYSGKVLTLSAEALRKVGPGEKEATVTFKSGNSA